MHSQHSADQADALLACEPSPSILTPLLSMKLLLSSIDYRINPPDQAIFCLESLCYMGQLSLIFFPANIQCDC